MIATSYEITKVKFKLLPCSHSNRQDCEYIKFDVNISIKVLNFQSLFYILACFFGDKEEFYDSNVIKNVTISTGQLDLFWSE